MRGQICEYWSSTAVASTVTRTGYLTTTCDTLSTLIKTSLLNGTNEKHLKACKATPNTSKEENK